MLSKEDVDAQDWMRGLLMYFVFVVEMLKFSG
jgi:hypothetical protein